MLSVVWLRCADSNIQAWAAGSMIGPLLAGLVVEARGWGTAVLILGCVSIVTALPTAVWTGGSIKSKPSHEADGEDGVEGEGAQSPA